MLRWTRFLIALASLPQKIVLWGILRRIGEIMRTLLTSMMIIWALTTLVGCGSNTVTAPVPPSNKDYLQELGDALKNLPPDIKKAPGKMSELDSIEPLIPGAGTAIRNGMIVYVWGA